MIQKSVLTDTLELSNGLQLQLDVKEKTNETLVCGDVKKNNAKRLKCVGYGGRVYVLDAIILGVTEDL